MLLLLHLSKNALVIYPHFYQQITNTFNNHGNFYNGTEKNLLRNEIIVFTSEIKIFRSVFFILTDEIKLLTMVFNIFTEENKVFTNEKIIFFMEENMKN